MEEQHIARHEIIRLYCEACGRFFCDRNDCKRVDRMNALLNEAIIPIPESKWIERMDWDGEYFYDCQKCGGTISSFDGNSADILHKFCPYCGARMRGIKYLPSKTDEE